MPGETSSFVRYADDIVVGFEHEADAKRFLADLQQRMEQFALSLHPDKTRLIEFGRFAAGNRARRGLDKPETFNFLGFTHICGRIQTMANSNLNGRHAVIDARQAAKDKRGVEAKDASTPFRSRGSGYAKW